MRIAAGEHARTENFETMVVSCAPATHCEHGESKQRTKRDVLGDAR